MVVTTHAEQYYGGKRIQQLGLGRALTLKKLKQQGITHLIALIQQVLKDKTIARNAQEFSKYLKSWNGAELAADAIERHMTT